MEIKVFLLDQISDFLKIKKNIYLYYSSVDFPSSSLKRKKRNNETVRPSSNYRNITMKLNYYVVWSHFYPLVTDESVSHEDAGRHHGDGPIKELPVSPQNVTVHLSVCLEQKVQMKHAGVPAIVTQAKVLILFP